MWCEGERGRSFNSRECKQLVNGDVREDRTLVAGDLVAYPLMLPPHPHVRGKTAETLDPKDYANDPNITRKGSIARFVRVTRYASPPLPPASLRYYTDLSLESRKQVDALRRYWISMNFFKSRLRTARWVIAIIFALPVVLLGGVYIAAIERVPLTGRWRIILLTPDEEDKISGSLEGANWFRSVFSLLSTAEGPGPATLPTSDWRWAWVQGVLSRLEQAAVSELQCETSGIQSSAPKASVDSSTSCIRPASFRTSRRSHHGSRASRFRNAIQPSAA